ncbi:hypothetical protein [Spongiimicrobium salis]|uniref:hypothetical protein n=1 Tax=Spongiimicrobium salis TaxID=1667022 RepID=UPI00374D9781
MKNSTLVFRSLAIIIFLAGMAHLVSYTPQEKPFDHGYEEPIDLDQTSPPIEDVGEEKKTNDNSGTYQIVGKWKVTYTDKDFKGAVIYDIKKEGRIFNAYTYQYQDEKGNTEKAEGTKTLSIKEFDGDTGKGIYSVAYEQQQYQVDCKIDVLDENTFKLQYDYFGYGDSETWKRQ